MTKRRDTMDKDQAIALAIDGAKKIQTALQWFEANESTAEIASLHQQLATVAARAEILAGVSAGTFANPLDGGGPKS